MADKRTEQLVFRNEVERDFWMQYFLDDAKRTGPTAYIAQFAANADRVVMELRARTAGPVHDVPPVVENGSREVTLVFRSPPEPSGKRAYVMTWMEDGQERSMDCLRVPDEHIAELRAKGYTVVVEGES